MDTSQASYSHCVWERMHRRSVVSVLRLVIGFCLVAVLGSLAANAQENWPQFRGPGSAGVSQATGLPDRWSATENIVWRTEIPGRGWSSPIVWGKHVFVTTAISEGQEEQATKGIHPVVGDRYKPSKNRRRWVVLCFDLETGGLLWQREVHQAFPDWPRHVKNSYASETPCTDGQRVYAYFGNVGMFAFSLDGKPVWERRWPRRKTRAHWGSGASPIVYEGRVYLVNDNHEQSFIEVMDSATGETVWKVDRDERSNWSTPLIWENAQRTEIVTPGTGKVRSYDLSGNLLWELTGMSGITIPTPLSGHGMVYISSGFSGSRKRPLYAICPGASGDISLHESESSNRFIAWSQPKAAAYNPSPLLLGDQIYVLLDRGTLASWDARTGAEVYSFQRIAPDAKAFTASPWAYDGKIFCLSEDGDTFVIQGGPEMKVLARNSLGEMCMSSPALVPGALIIRTTEALYRIGASPTLQ